MPWRWPWSRRTDEPSSAGDAADSTTHRTLGGRRFLRNVPYVLPSDMGEINRLDFQHYMMRYALRGNYAAPIGRAPERILDVGCGTGRWVIEMAQTFPDAAVTGVDITPPALDSVQSGSEARLANVAFVTGDVLDRLPFEDHQFGYTHQRYMISGIPLEQWPRAIGELARVTRPGGWVEVVEADTSGKAGPALRQADDWVAAVLARRGLDIHLARNLERWLQEAGLRQVKLRQVDLPLGKHGGRVGSLVESNYFAAFDAMRAPVVALGLASEEQYEATINAAREEVRRGSCVFPIYIAYGQR